MWRVRRAAREFTMDLAEWIAVQNVTRFTDQLRSESDPFRRQRLQTLLIEEEDRLASNYEQLAKFEDEIAKSEERINFQRARVAAMESAERDTTAARSVLENLVQIQAIYKQHRQRIVETIGRSAL